MNDTIYVGHCLTVLHGLADDSVHCVVTSIPYWGLRTYHTEPQVWGGDREHTHTFETVTPPGYRKSDTKPGTIVSKGATGRNALKSGMCECGAWKGELGLEPAPELFVNHIVQIFRQLRRVLRKDGICWLNVGDSYFATGSKQTDTGKAAFGPEDWPQDRVYSHHTLKPKDLCLIPFRLALALQEDGWWIRSDSIWEKPNPQPESVHDRPTRSHEYVFMLTKSRLCYFDWWSVTEQGKVDERVELVERLKVLLGLDRALVKNLSQMALAVPTGGRQRRSVWKIAPRPLKGVHFATFPPRLAELCIYAGTSERGACPDCGAPWKRRLKPTERYQRHLGRDWADDAQDEKEGRGHFDRGDGRRATQRRTKRRGPSLSAEYEHAGWEPTCKHAGLEPVPCVVLDPFMGSGTVGLVARRSGRAFIGIELNEGYALGAVRRIDGELHQGRHTDLVLPDSLLQEAAVS